MPAISDPGEDLVRLCAEAGIEVAAVPGPTAALTALALSGLPTGRFTFEGFLSTARQSRREHLASLGQEQRTMIFYEAPHKLRATLADLAETFGGERRIALCRELTKLHEEVIRTTLGDACARYGLEAPRGEFVLILEGAPEQKPSGATPDEALALARRLVEQGSSPSAAREARGRADRTAQGGHLPAADRVSGNPAFYKSAARLQSFTFPPFPLLFPLCAVS